MAPALERLVQVYDSQRLFQVGLNEIRMSLETVVFRNLEPFVFESGFPVTLLLQVVSFSTKVFPDNVFIDIQQGSNFTCMFYDVEAPRLSDFQVLSRQKCEKRRCEPSPTAGPTPHGSTLPSD